ncbi:hypothetical protein B0A49_05842 [Cryomyces minteri]|uniref:HNH domain-containing protein n=1 Tax=Cryomyces minteri TaxID=331657 RepID=A0A4U0XD64_9PEZI|nr:hypothetical protein B0A49_05842 [Cryomyces minteri]
MLSDDEKPNYETFRDCLEGLVIQKLAIRPAKTRRRRPAKGSKNAIKPVEVSKEAEEEPTGNDAAELGEFVDVQLRRKHSESEANVNADSLTTKYLATEIFTSLAPELRTLSYAAVQNDAALRAKYEEPLPTSTLESILSPLPISVVDSLSSYGLLPATADLSRFLGPVLSDYVTSTTTALQEYAPQTRRASACEICDRDWIPLTYHHLIPRAVHAKVLKRGWHEEWELNKVAWLCRACHSMVHGIASNEELAKEWFSVERLREREDVQKWAGWAGRVRWKTR